MTIGTTLSKNDPRCLGEQCSKASQCARYVLRNEPSVKTHKTMKSKCYDCSAFIKYHKGKETLIWE